MKGDNMRLRILKPLIAALSFIALALFVSYRLRPIGWFALFITSPFNISVEAQPLYNIYLPALLILIIGIYLKNFNRSFMRKCNLRAIVGIGLLSNYIEIAVSYLHYGAISLGTSVITLSFLAAFLIAFEGYVARKEQAEHLYGHFIFILLIALSVVLMLFIFLAFFASASALVHTIGITTFLLLFISYYERANITRLVAARQQHVSIREHRLEDGFVKSRRMQA